MNANNNAAEIGIDRLLTIAALAGTWRPGNLVWSEMHRCHVRIVRYTDGFLVVADPATGRELPDYVHVTQVRRV